MKKILGIVGILMILGIGVAVATGSVTVYNASGVAIGSYTTIQAGVNACPTGGTVSVAAGTYTEAVSINKRIALVGVGTPTITAAELGATTTVTFDGTGTLISGFIITGATGTTWPFGIGIYCINGASPTITTNTISGNSYSGIYCSASSPIINYNCVWGNGLTGTQNYTGCSSGVYDISANPQFIGGGDYHLGSSSPCIDAGSNTAPGIYGTSTDKDGNPRILRIVDMGAYEFQGTPTLSARFTATSTTGTKPLLVQFTDQSIGNITGRLWQFGDGGTSSEQSPAHTYTTTGSFIVILRVEGPGGIDTATKTDYITVYEPTPPPNQLPTATITSIAPNPATYGTTVNFVGTGTDADGTITTCLWQSDIAGILSNQASFATSTLPVGTHNISFSVRDNIGSWSAPATDTLVILPLPAPNQLPTATITGIIPNPATSGVTVNFVGTGTDADGTITAYLWQSDTAGTLSQLADFGISTLAVGTHNISFSVQDNIGSWSTPATATLVIISVLSGEVVTLLNEPVTGPMIIVEKGTQTIATAIVSAGRFAILSLPCATYTLSARAVSHEGVINSISGEVMVPISGVRFVLPVGYRLSLIAGMIPAGVAKHSAQAMALQEDISIGLYLENRLIAVTNPDSSGRFEFKGLLPANYTLKVEQNGTAIKEKTVLLGKEESLEVEFSRQAEPNILKNVLAYPNPTDINYITLRFESDKELLEAKIRIYTIAGEMVKVISCAEINKQQTVYTYIWYLDNVASGIYLYEVIVETKEGEHDYVVKKLGIVK